MPIEEPLDERGRAALGALLHEGYRARAEGREQIAVERFEAVAARLADARPGTSRPWRKVPTRGGVAAMVSEDGALFYRVPSGEPLAFEPAMAVVDGLEAASVAIFVVSADGNEESQSGKALYDPLAGRRLAQGRHLLLRADATMAYVQRSSDCAWEAWDIVARNKSHELTLPEPAPGWWCREGLARPFLTRDGRWLIATGGAWDLTTRRLTPAVATMTAPLGFAEATSADGRFVAYFRAPLPPESDPMLWRAGAELTLLDLDRGRETTFQDPTFANLANECPLAFVPAPSRLVVLDYNAWSFRVPDLRLLGKRPTSPAAFHSLGLPDPPPQPDCGQMIIATHVDPPPARICEREGFPLPLAFCSR
ncbi:MAG: hypothetical protein KC731_08135 [Myxococcales bacterium]|nr:hypothetical protein [Myxococcales bacterium]